MYDIKLTSYNKEVKKQVGLISEGFKAIMFDMTGKTEKQIISKLNQIGLASVKKSDDKTYSIAATPSESLKYLGCLIALKSGRALIDNTKNYEVGKGLALDINPVAMICSNHSFKGEVKGDVKIQCLSVRIAQL